MDTDLKRWSSRPLWLLNAAAVVATAVLMVWLFRIAPRAADPDMSLRYAAIFFMSIHGLLHFSSRYGLKLMVEHHREGAEAALRAYLDVRRISHLDQAVAWIAYFVIAPHLV